MVADSRLVGNYLIMSSVPDLAAVWQPGSTVFSACMLDGSEVLLWLVPHVYGFESITTTPPEHTVSFVCSSLHPPLRQPSHPPVQVPLVPRWWVFEDFCQSATCVCGARSLLEVVSLLPRRLASQALAAHVDLHAALWSRLEVSQDLGQVGPRVDHLRLALSSLSEDLRPLGLYCDSSRTKESIV
jgi:hypothetical protein